LDLDFKLKHRNRKEGGESETCKKKGDLLMKGVLNGREEV